MPGVRESRARGGAASWAGLAAVAVCGGVQKLNLASRVGCEACAGSPAIGIAVPVTGVSQARGASQAYRSPADRGVGSELLPTPLTGARAPGAR